MTREKLKISDYMQMGVKAISIAGYINIYNLSVGAIEMILKNIPDSIAIIINLVKVIKLRNKEEYDNLLYEELLLVYEMLGLYKVLKKKSEILSINDE
ncbi:LbetaH domain-containing protein [Acinetobacter variabilis]|uniref:hypothetical protein n=1 Tax=Acinetobacter variabilis TaxID=70346 RepID=UPI00376F5AB7